MHEAGLCENITAPPSREELCERNENSQGIGVEETSKFEALSFRDLHVAAHRCAHDLEDRSRGLLQSEALSACVKASRNVPLGFDLYGLSEIEHLLFAHAVAQDIPYPNQALDRHLSA